MNLSGGVTQWDDQSGQANHAVQATDSRAPILVTGAVNGRPVLRFDGVDDFLDVADSDSLSGTGDKGFATVRKEWWPYEDPQGRTHPVLDVPFEALQPAEP